MGRGSQEVMEMDQILTKCMEPHTTTAGKAQLARQAMVRDYVWKLANVLLVHISTHGFCVVDNFLGGEAGSLLLEEISAPNPYTHGEGKGIKYLLNLLDSVVILAGRKARQTGARNILSEITRRDSFLTVGRPVPDPNGPTTKGLTATIFLNKDWKVETEGGELSLSPSPTTLATIPPVFDRVVFYPPHSASPSILPSNRDSISCTVAYKG